MTVPDNDNSTDNPTGVEIGWGNLGHPIVDKWFNTQGSLSKSNGSEGVTAAPVGDDVEPGDGLTELPQGWTPHGPTTSVVNLPHS